MIELHDATGTWSQLSDLVDYRIRPDVVTILQKHQAYLLVNIGNEVADDNVTKDDFVDRYTDAVQRMRAAGIHTPSVIDARSWGHEIEMFNDTDDPDVTTRLLDADPDCNLIFSVHAYWSKACGYDESKISSLLQQAVNKGYPLIVGEFSAYGGWPCGSPKGTSVCSPAGEIEYRAILKACRELQIGWYVWEWGPGNDQGNPPDPECRKMDMTTNSKFETLQWEWAKEVASSIRQDLQE